MFAIDSGDIFQNLTENKKLVIDEETVRSVIADHVWTEKELHQSIGNKSK